jgi:hypothetical protein
MQYTFNLKSEIILQRDGSKVVMEKLCLAFEDVSEALKWRQAIARQASTYPLLICQLAPRSAKGNHDLISPGIQGEGIQCCCDNHHTDFK